MHKNAHIPKLNLKKNYGDSVLRPSFWVLDITPLFANCALQSPTLWNRWLQLYGEVGAVELYNINRRLFGVYDTQNLILISTFLCQGIKKFEIRKIQSFAQ